MNMNFRYIAPGRYTEIVNVEVATRYALQRSKLNSIGKTEPSILPQQHAIGLHGGIVSKIDRQFSFLRFVEL